MYENYIPIERTQPKGEIFSNPKLRILNRAINFYSLDTRIFPGNRSLIIRTRHRNYRLLVQNPNTCHKHARRETFTDESFSILVFAHLDKKLLAWFILLSKKHTMYEIRYRHFFRPSAPSRQSCYRSIILMVHNGTVLISVTLFDNLFGITWIFCSLRGYLSILAVCSRSVVRIQRYE